jgi:hypothetical protein
MFRAQKELRNALVSVRHKDRDVRRGRSYASERVFVGV